jgi:hypothetical protein
MKRATLVLAFFVVAVGTASAAIFTPPPALPLEAKPSAKIALAKPSAPLSIQTARPPVPLPDLPKPPAVEIASLPESMPAEIAPSPPTARPTANLANGRATEQDVSNLAGSYCGGRSIKSIAVMPDGSAQLQC